MERHTHKGEVGYSPRNPAAGWSDKDKPQEVDNIRQYRPLGQAYTQVAVRWSQCKVHLPDMLFERACKVDLADCCKIHPKSLYMCLTKLSYLPGY